MNCPNCGTQTLPDQQFCRACGASLMADEARSVNRRMLWGPLLAFVGIAIALVGKMLLHLEIFTLVGVLISLAGMFFIAAYPYLLRNPKKRGIDVLSQPQSLAPAETTNKLPPISAIDHFPSVTEGTTELLKDPAPVYRNSGR